MSTRAPGILLGNAEAVDSTVSSIPCSLSPTTLIVEPRGSEIVDIVAVDEGIRADMGRSRPVAAANLICMDSGTPPGLTQGRIVN